MRHNLIFLIAIMIIVAVTVDKIEDAISDNIFKEEMTEFMNRGSRNTAVMGKDICERVNVLESKSDIKNTDCKEVYKWITLLY